MSFTAQPGTSSSQLGNIEPGNGAAVAPTPNIGAGSITISHPTYTSTGTVRADPLLQKGYINGGSFTFGSNITSGSTLVVSTGRVDNGTRIGSITDTLGNTWVKTISAFVGNGLVCEQWAAFGCFAGANTVTIHYSAGGGANLAFYELALLRGGKFGTSSNGGTGSEASGTSHTTTSVTSTGYAVLIEAAQTSGILGTPTPGTNFYYDSAPITTFYTQAGVLSNGGTTTGAWTSSGGTASAQILGYYNDADLTGTAAVTIHHPTLAATGSEGDTGSGSFTIHHPTLSGTGNVTINGTGGITISHPTLLGAEQVIVGTGSITIQHPTLLGAEQLITGDGSLTIHHPTLSGLGGSGTSGSGGIIILHPTFSGSGIFSNPFLSITQAPTEDLEIPDTRQLLDTQAPVEDLEYFDAPIESMDQIAVEDLELYNLPILRLDQMVVEILIPFDCNLTPPLILPPGCPPDEIEGEGSASGGCNAMPTTGSGTSKSGCKPTFRN